MGLAPFKINYRYMPAMMKEMRTMEKTPQGVKTFTRNALKNMTLVHDVLIKDRIFHKDTPTKNDVGNLK